MKVLPNLDYELELWGKGFLVCGIDEVGRGSFAGPLVVCATALKPIEKSSEVKKLLSLGINDSKLVSGKNRELIYNLAQEFMLFSSLHYISVDIINEKKMGFANKKGFELAAKSVSQKLKNDKIFFLTDYFKIPRINNDRQKNIVRGDSISLSIALASILAKVERDRFMTEIAKVYKLYGFEKNKGYGTFFHRSSLKQYGPSPIHRAEFIRNHI